MFAITGPAQLVLKAFSASGKYDKIARGNFESGEALPSVPQPKKTKQGGLKYSYYEGNWDKIPDFKRLKPVQTGLADSLFLFSAFFRDTHVNHCKSIYDCYFWVSRNNKICLSVLS
jgi:hypothetical protein